jgi:hypothetical protein
MALREAKKMADWKSRRHVVKISTSRPEFTAY